MKRFRLRDLLLILICLLLWKGSLVYAQSSPPIQIYFFYTEDCQPCQAILQGYLPSLQTMFPSIEIKSFDVGNPAYYEALSKLERRFGRPGKEFPVVLIGDDFLSGEMEIMERLNPLILEYQVKGGTPLTPLPIPSSMKWEEELGEFKKPFLKI